MAGLPPRGVFDPLTEQYAAALAREVAPTFWQQDETIIRAGLGQHVPTATRLGRGEGEGCLYLTTHRFIFRFDRPPNPFGRFLTLEKTAPDRVKVTPSWVVDVTSRWIIVPGMRELTLKMDSPVPPTLGNLRVQKPQAWWEISFYVGGTFARLVERDWRSV